MNYECIKCQKAGVKLWRRWGMISGGTLCRACGEKQEGRRLESIAPLIGNLMPAVRKEDGTFFKYGDIPAQLWTWWRALPEA